MSRAAVAVKAPEATRRKLRNQDFLKKARPDAQVELIERNVKFPHDNG